jgi:hypothetical protein
LTPSSAAPSESDPSNIDKDHDQSDLSNTLAVVTCGRIGASGALSRSGPPAAGPTVVIPSARDASSTVAKIQATGATAE